MQVTFQKYSEYKDSGVEWLLKIPDHWKLGRIKDFIDTTPNVSTPATLTEKTPVEFLPMANVDEETGKIKSFDFQPLRDVASGYKKFVSVQP